MRAHFVPAVVVLRMFTIRSSKVLVFKTACTVHTLTATDLPKAQTVRDEARNVHSERRIVPPQLEMEKAFVR